MGKIVCGHQVITHAIKFDTDPSDFGNWTDGAGVAGSVTKTISSDGSSVTFTRDTPNDGSNCRRYVEFTYGEFANIGDRISVRCTITQFDGGAGSPTTHIYAQTGTVVAISGDSKRRTVISDGNYGMVLETTVANLLGFSLRVGIGTFENDTSTNAITISNVQVTHAHVGQTKPDPLVRYSPPANAVNRISGDVILGSNANTYNPTTGILVDADNRSVTQKIENIGLMCGDSFFAGNTTTGSMIYRLEKYYRQYVIYANATGGRTLESIANTGTFLDALWAEPGAARSKWLAINAAANDVITNSRDDADLLAYDQLIYQWCIERGLYYIKFGLSPFAGKAGFVSGWQTIIDTYNAVLAENPFGDKFIYVDNYCQLESATAANNLNASIDSGDQFHPSNGSLFQSRFGSDYMIEQFLVGVAQVSASSTSRPYGNRQRQAFN